MPTQYEIDNCKKKKVFDTAKKAKRYASGINRMNKRIGDHKAMRDYRCKVCRCWHITSKKDYNNVSSNNVGGSNYLQPSAPEDSSGDVQT